MTKTIWLKVSVEDPLFSFKNSSYRIVKVCHKNDQLAFYFASKKEADDFAKEMPKSAESALEILRSLKELTKKYNSTSNYGDGLKFFGNLFLE